MSNQQILEKAIQKAIDGGWTGYKAWDTTDAALLARMEFDEYADPQAPLIFNHNFAKALWGDDYERPCPWCLRDDIPLGVKTYERHLMDMVIADDPIKYLGENI